MDQGIADIRKNYSLQSLLETSALPNAIKQFSIWWDEAIKAEIDEVNAMTLATASADGVPAARIVLLKEFSDKGFVFFTNYNSFKGQQLLENPKACLVFFWKELERQVRITGLIQKIDAIDSDAYFFSRPIGSQVGAISSPQSQVIPNREWLDDTYEKNEKKMALQPINRPEHWGGYIVKPVIIEFWQGRPSRLHDRLQYTLEDDGSWKIERLAP
jgi:pyridoxamine 5'-phosphate oxidase